MMQPAGFSVTSLYFILYRLIPDFGYCKLEQFFTKQQPNLIYVLRPVDVES